jgi:RecJ-like exonuclease
MEQENQPNEPMNPGDEAPPNTTGAGEDICRACEGTGQVEDRQCEVCGGTGKVQQGIGGG